MFGKTYNFHLSNGNVVKMKHVEKLSIKYGNDAKITSYEATFSKFFGRPLVNGIFHVSPLDIVAISR